MRGAGAMLMFFATLTIAAASEDCALGWYWNGVKCQPLQVYTPREWDYWTHNFPEKGYPNCTADAAVRPDLQFRTSSASHTSAIKTS